MNLLKIATSILAIGGQPKYTTLQNQITTQRQEMVSVPFINKVSYSSNNYWEVPKLPTVNGQPYVKSYSSHSSKKTVSKDEKASSYLTISKTIPKTISVSPTLPVVVSSKVSTSHISLPGKNPSLNLNNYNLPVVKSHINYNSLDGKPLLFDLQFGKKFNTKQISKIIQGHISHIKSDKIYSIKVNNQAFSLPGKDIINTLKSFMNSKNMGSNNGNYLLPIGGSSIGVMAMNTKKSNPFPISNKKITMENEKTLVPQQMLLTMDKKPIKQISTPKDERSKVDIFNVEMPKVDKITMENEKTLVPQHMLLTMDKKPIKQISTPKDERSKVDIFNVERPKVDVALPKIPIVKQQADIPKVPNNNPSQQKQPSKAFQIALLASLSSVPIAALVAASNPSIMAVS